MIAPVIARIASATKTQAHNSESLQLLQYEVGQVRLSLCRLVDMFMSAMRAPCDVLNLVFQYYNQHHDYIEYQADLPCGVR